MNRPTPRLTLSLFALAAAISVPAMRAQDGMPADCPMHAEHQKKAAEAAAGAAAPAAIPAPAATTGLDSTAAHTGHAAASGSAASPYVGMESRAIAALSEEEIAALRAGSGHGMALPAEIHHYPGPRHLIDLASELALDARAVGELSSIYDRMHAGAVALGERIVAGERELDRLFADGRATSAEVSRLTAEIARLRGALRAAHLVAHVEAKALLTAEQVARRDALRGYEAAADTP